MGLFIEIQGQLVEPPINLDAVRVQLNFDTEDPDAKESVTVTELEFTRDGAAIINNYIEQGKNGGPGIFEGLPSVMGLREGGATEILIDGYLDLAASNAVFECDRVVANLVQRGGNDWFNNRIEGISFPFLAEKVGIITKDDIVQVPYIISTIPNSRDVAIITLTGFTLVFTLFQTIKDIPAIVARLAGFFTTLPAIIEALVYAIYLSFLIIAIVQVIIDLIDVIIQPIKYHAGMKLQTLLEKGAQYLGVDFKSSFFDDPFWQGATIIPAKYNSFNSGNASGVLGFLAPTPSAQTGYPSLTYGQLLSAAEDMWNARHVSLEGVVQVERVDKNTSQHNFVVPDVEIRANQKNSNDLKANYNIRFQTDLSDENTIDEYTGTLSGVTVSPLNVINEDAVLISGIEDVNIPFALAKTKTELTKPEQFFDDVISAIGPFLNNITATAPPLIKGFLPTADLSNLIKDRIGMMKLSSDAFSIDKIVSLDINEDNPRYTKIKSDNDQILNSEYLWNNNHFVNSFVVSDKLPEPNQWIKYITPSPFTLCLEDYLKVKSNNLIFDSNGSKGKLVSMEWNPQTKEATTEFWIKEIYNTNLEETVSTPDGT